MNGMSFGNAIRAETRTFPIAPDAAWDHFTDYPAWHDVMFTNPDIRKYVVATLTGKTPPPEAVITPRELLALGIYLNAF